MGAGSSRNSRNRGVIRSNSLQDVSRFANRSLSSSFKYQLQCAIHEVGSQHGCRSENYLQQRGDGALVGLHSNWIGHFILAAARPSDLLIAEHHILYQFHSQHIGAIINLQVPGEHAGCGDGVLQSSGFSYTPERFMEKHIYYFNFPWDDMYSLNPDYTLDICHTIDSRIAAGDKVAIHCHSGIGRTGLVIACYFLYSGAYDEPMEAIQNIRNERRGALKSRRQVKLVKDFNTFLHSLRVHFVQPEEMKKSAGDVKGFPNLQEVMIRQRKILHGSERRALLYVPKIVDWITRDLIRRTGYNTQKREKVAGAFMDALTSPGDTAIIGRVKDKINAADWGGVEELEAVVLFRLLIEWLVQLQEPIIPDVIVTTSLGRGDIESAIDELSKADKCEFATLQILACFMFQIVPVKPKAIRQLYSALAHVLLSSSSLQSVTNGPQDSEIEEEGESEKEVNPNSAQRHRVSRYHNVYAKFKPTALETEYGLLLEASARFWIKLGRARQEESKRKTTRSSGVDGSGEQTQELNLSQPWFRDRASLQYEQYNPADSSQLQKEAEAPSSKDPRNDSTKTASRTSGWNSPRL